MKRKILTLSLGFFLFGCAPSLTPGRVAMKINDGEAHVCLGENQMKVKEGDKVGFFNNNCGTKHRHANGSPCSMNKIGEGVVTQLLDERCSVVRVVPGTKFEEGNMVEKLQP